MADDDEAADRIAALEGGIVGEARHSLNTADFSSFLLRARSTDETPLVPKRYNLGA